MYAICGLGQIVKFFEPDIFFQILFCLWTSLLFCLKIWIRPSAEISPRNVHAHAKILVLVLVRRATARWWSCYCLVWLLCKIGILIMFWLSCKASSDRIRVPSIHLYSTLSLWRAARVSHHWNCFLSLTQKKYVFWTHQHQFTRSLGSILYPTLFVNYAQWDQRTNDSIEPSFSQKLLGSCRNTSVGMSVSNPSFLRIWKHYSSKLINSFRIRAKSLRVSS